NQQFSKFLDAHVRYGRLGDNLLPECDALIDRKEQFFIGQGVNSNDQCVKVLCGPPCDIEMTVGEWIEASRIYGDTVAFFLTAHAFIKARRKTLGLNHGDMRRVPFWA